MGYASIINLRLATEEGADINGNIAAAKATGIPYGALHDQLLASFRSPRPL